MLDFSYVIISYNRCERLVKTLEYLLAHTPGSRDRWELIVVDNASTDDTAQTVAERFGEQVQLIELTENIGMPARNCAIEKAQGRYIVILDDDSYPMMTDTDNRGGNTDNTDNTDNTAVERAIDYMQGHDDVAAVTGRVVLPDGKEEAPAFATVFIGCATVLRKAALDEVGLFDEKFFRQAEEYDLSFRLAGCGWKIARLNDAVYRHDKHIAGRSSALTCCMDLRNNLILAKRYLSGQLQKEYQADWRQRYEAIARYAGCHEVIDEALRQSNDSELIGQYSPLTGEALEAMFQLEYQSKTIERWAKENDITQVVIADLSKNMFATWRGCEAAGVRIVAVANRSPAFEGLRYRGVDLVDDEIALHGEFKFDGVILSNTNPAQIDERFEQLRASYDGSILRL